MNIKAFTDYLTGLSLEDRAKLLVRIGAQLTIYAREYGILGPDSENNRSNHKKLAGTNELQHKLLNQAGLYLKGEREKIYPADVLSETMFQTAEHYGIAPDPTTAILHAQQKP
jgi:hypothetical protein